MKLQLEENGGDKHQVADALLERALLLDLEVSHQGAILKIGAVLGSLTLVRSGRGSFAGIVGVL
jgi:hypothetical protein